MVGMGKMLEEGLMARSLRVPKRGAQRISSKHSSTPISSMEAVVRLLHTMSTYGKPNPMSVRSVGLGLLFMLNDEKRKVLELRNGEWGGGTPKRHLRGNTNT